MTVNVELTQVELAFAVSALEAAVQKNVTLPSYFAWGSDPEVKALNQGDSQENYRAATKAVYEKLKTIQEKFKFGGQTA